MLNLANFIGVSVYLWLVDEKNHFLQTNLQKTPSEKKCSQLFICKSKCRIYLFVDSGAFPYLICVCVLQTQIEKND